MAHTDAEVETILLSDTTGIEFKTRGCTAEIDPGMLVAYDGDGAAPHGDDGGRAKPMFALEADQWGKTIRDPLLVDEEVTIAFGKVGTNFYAFAAAGEDITAGDALVSNGDGTLRVYDDETDDPHSVVVDAYEDVDNSAETEPARIRVEC